MNKMAYIFPGQGSQVAGMGKEFYENFETAREMFDAASEKMGYDFKALMFHQDERLSQTEFTQPAILLHSIIAHTLFVNELNIKPIYLMGHSLGEITALCATGAIDYLDAVALVAQRGKLMQEACEGNNPGMLAVLGLDDELVEGISKIARDMDQKKIWPANYNSNGQVVVAGDKDDLASVADAYKKGGAKRVIPLDMSVASHCPMLQSALSPFAKELEAVLGDFFLSPVISNVTAKPYDSKSEAQDLLPKQLISPVLYKQSVYTVDDSVDMYIEFGGSVLKGLNKKSTKKMTHSVFDIVSFDKTLSELS